MDLASSSIRSGYSPSSSSSSAACSTVSSDLLAGPYRRVAVFSSRSSAQQNEIVNVPLTRADTTPVSGHATASGSPLSALASCWRVQIFSEETRAVPDDQEISAALPDFSTLALEQTSSARQHSTQKRARATLR